MANISNGYGCRPEQMSPRRGRSLTSRGASRPALVRSRPAVSLREPARSRAPRLTRDSTRALLDDRQAAALHARCVHGTRGAVGVVDAFGHARVAQRSGSCAERRAKLARVAALVL